MLAFADTYNYAASSSSFANVSVDRPGCGALSERVLVRAQPYYQANNIFLISVTCPATEFAGVGSALTLGYAAYDKTAGVYNSGTWDTYTLTSVAASSLGPLGLSQSEALNVLILGVIVLVYSAGFAIGRAP